MTKEEVKTKENPNAKWYVLNIRTGYENSIQKELKQRIEATGMEDKIVDILVPVQKKIFVKKGKQDVKEEKIFPGYVLITKFMEVEQPSFQNSFSVGEAVKIVDGAFADFIGSVQDVDTEKGKIKVLISFLGREAPVELDLTQVSKL